MTDRLHKHGRFFDVWSRFYRAGPFGWELRRIQRRALRALAAKTGERVLDLGCGPADGAAWLRARGVNAIGLDYSEGMLESARRQPELRGRLIRGDAGRLPFATGAFDHLVCTNSFHHYPDHQAALGEMRRVLRPGGRLLLVDPLAGTLGSFLAIDLGERLLFRLEEVRTFTLEAWPRMLREAGFSSASVRRGSALSPVAFAEVFVEATA